MGRPQFTRSQRLHNAKERGIVVDPEDEWLLEEFSWYVHRTGYVAATIYPSRTMVFLHHYIVGFPVWKSDEVDHANGDKLNNSRSNISIRTVHENKQNRATVSMAANVYPRSSGNWSVKIHRNGMIYHETFPTMKAAVEARNAFLTNIHEDSHG